MTDGNDSEMKALLASKAVDQIADYNQRGRSYKALPNEGLVQSWRSIWNELAVEPLNENKRDVQADISAEFMLRGLEPPSDLVADQVEIYLAEADRAFEIWRQQNPDAEAQANDAIADDLKRFQRSRKHSN
jgi:hypothetical protein